MSGYTFRGANRSGAGVSGHATTLPAAFVEARFRAGWRWLVLEDDSGEQIGGIAPGVPHTQRRTWWAES